MKSSTVLFAGLASLVMLSACDRPADPPQVPAGGIVIDTDVKGTRVFFGDSELGTVPVRLTGEKLISLGLPRTDADHVTLGGDGWGECVFWGVEDKLEHKFHFLAPDPELYFIAQTPWGARTRIAGGRWGEKGRNYLKAKLNPRASETIDVAIEDLGWTARGLSVRVRVKNTTGESFSGYRPEVSFLWGAMNTPWRRRSRHEVQLPEPWSTLDPGELQSATIDLPLGDVGDGVSLFCVFHLFKEETGGVLAGKGAVYGDSIWVSAAPK